MVTDLSLRREDEWTQAGFDDDPCKAIHRGRGQTPDNCPTSALAFQHDVGRGVVACAGGLDLDPDDVGRVAGDVRQ